MKLSIRLRILVCAMVGLLGVATPAQVVRTIVQNGPSAELYDMVILGDGYTAAQQSRFDQDCLDVINYFQNNAGKFPYGAYFNFYNVHTVFRASNQSGADQPPNNIFRDTAYDASYWTGGTERCLYIGNTSLAARDAALAPDTDGRVIVLVNDSKYGGCAGAFSVGYNGSLMEDVQAHEWGHSFGGLADEYGGSGTWTGGEFSQPNITNSSTGNKWAEWLGAQGPVSVVGAYEGVRYHNFGIWRPETDCEMRSLNRPFCAVCRQYMIRRFHQQVQVIHGTTPAASQIPARQGSSLDFSIAHRITSRPHTIEWRVGAAGAWQPGSTQFRWNIGSTAPGPIQITARLRDTSAEVRRDPNGDLVHEHSWQVDVQADDPKLRSGITEQLREDLVRVNGPIGSDLPFGQAGASRVLQAYERSTLGHDHAVHIAALAFRPDESVGGSFPAQQWDLRVDLSTGSRAASQLSTTFDSNHGPDRARLFDGQLLVDSRGLGTAPHPSVLVIPLDEPFQWNPRLGPLVVDLRCRALLSGSARTMDAMLARGGDVGRVAHAGNADAVTANTGPQGMALACELILDMETAPAGLAGTALTPTAAIPWNLPDGTGSRVQWIQDRAALDLDGRHALTRLGFRPHRDQAFVSRSYNMRVTLSTGAAGLAAAGPSSRFDDNHGADRTIVYDGVWTPGPLAAAPAPAPFGLQLEFQRPFEFNPDSGSLVVDVELRRVTGPQSCDFETSRGTTPHVARVRAGGVNQSTGTVENEALVLALAGHPVPVAPASVDAVEGSLSTALPWGPQGALRYQLGFAPSEFDVRDPVEITHLSWRADASTGGFGPATWRARIDIGRNTTLPLIPLLNGNAVFDRVTVFDGTFSVPRVPAGASRADDFEITVRLDRPYRWDPADGPLVVDVQKQATIAGDGPTALDAESGSAAGISSAWFLGSATGTTAVGGVPAEATVVRFGGAVAANALTTPYGSGCTGASGIPIASSYGLPWLGNADYRMAAFQAAPGTNAAFLFGLARANTPLDRLGAVGCTAWTTGDLGTLGAVVGADSIASIPSAVPDVPALAGGTFTTQWAILDPSAPANLVMSNGLEITMR